MTHFLDESCLAELRAALSGCEHLIAGSSDMTVAEGFIEVRCQPLEGRAVCVAMTVDGILWVVIDPDKPNALKLAGEMLEEWCASYLTLTGIEADSERQQSIAKTDTAPVIAAH